VRALLLGQNGQFQDAMKDIDRGLVRCPTALGSSSTSAVNDDSQFRNHDVCCDAIGIASRPP